MYVSLSELNGFLVYEVVISLTFQQVQKSILTSLWWWVVFCLWFFFLASGYSEYRQYLYNLSDTPDLFFFLLKIMVLVQISVFLESAADKYYRTEFTPEPPVSSFKILFSDNLCHSGKTPRK